MRSAKWVILHSYKLAGAEELTRKAISELRLEMGKRLGLRKEDEFRLLWVLDFPLFEYAAEDNRLGGSSTIHLLHPNQRRLRL
jgi:aspartyl-tRNA synthetase